ncbi:hypothetical protein ALQ88_05871 [Pseudomonas savastanoi]|nr:hypothetical protein ALQ88_05871 [Pseudomonas savastanoi]
MHQRALSRLPVLTEQLRTPDTVGIFTKCRHIARQPHEPGVDPARAVGLQVKPAVARTGYAPVMQVLQRIAQPVVERLAPLLAQQTITQVRLEISQLQKCTMGLFPLRRLPAQFAVQTGHQLGVRGLSAVLALAGIRLGPTVIAVASGKCLVAPHIAIGAVRLAGIAKLDRARFTQRVEHLANRLGKPWIVVRTHPVVGFDVDRRQRRFDAVGITPGQLDRINALLQSFAQHVGLVIVGIRHQHTVVTALALDPGEHVSGQKRAGDMTYVQIAIRGGRRDGHDVLTHRGTPWFRCAEPRKHSRSSCPTTPHRSGSPRRNH